MSDLSRHIVEFNLDGRWTNEYVLLEDGYTTIDDIPKILAVFYSTTVDKIEVLSHKVVG